MSSSHSSSGGRGPPSSPFTGTDPTSYSPETARKPAKSAVAKGKEPVAQSAPEPAATSAVARQPVVQLGRPPVGLPVVEPGPSVQRPNVVQHVAAAQHFAAMQPAVQPAAQPMVPTVTINGIKYIGLHPQPHADGIFINELDPKKNPAIFISRFVKVMAYPQVPPPGTDMDYELGAVRWQLRHYECFNRCVVTYSRGVYLHFDDIRDACEGQHVLHRASFETTFIDTYDFALAKTQDTATIDEFEGQVKVVVLVKPSGLRPWGFGPQSIPWLDSIVMHNMSVFGSVRNNIHCKTDDRDTHILFTFRVEYNSAEAAIRAVASLKRDPMPPNMVDETKPGLAWTIVEVENWTGPRASNSPHRRKPRIDDRGRLTEFRLAPLVDFNRRHINDAHNRVRRDRILDGTDVRTTIMLRNIPNKLDWLSLKKMLDDVCFGTYDFIYLRIDFKTACNVGYAFINFADINGMLSILDNIEGKGWVGYKSNKSAEISYATIQGKDALTAKFRNSSVMQEAPFCRPRLFYAYDDVSHKDFRLTGCEETFPNPDNMSKLQRSIESAKNQGLFPATGTSHGNRNLITEYDRGNPRDLSLQAQLPVRARTDMTDVLKQKCVELFFYKYGGCMYGPVPFVFIPDSFIDDFLAQFRYEATGRLSPGPIGRPQSLPFYPHSVSAANGSVSGPSNQLVPVAIPPARQSGSSSGYGSGNSRHDGLY